MRWVWVRVLDASAVAALAHPAFARRSAGLMLKQGDEFGGVGALEGFGSIDTLR